MKSPIRPCRATSHILRILGLTGSIGLTTVQIDRSVRDNTQGFRSHREFLRAIESLPGVVQEGDRWRLA